METVRFLSVCSGIEAASVAWHGLDFEPVAFSEIEPFPSALLSQHYPNVPNWGDMTKFKEWPDASVSLLVGGTPCQAFSVAGLRRGLADPRGNLTLTFLAIADRYRPEWILWENVPGVLSIDGGRTFGTFLGGLGELGYGFAYRVLDAQFFGVAQRRRRVFVVANARDWRRAAAVLFEPESLRGDSPPSRETREDAPAKALRGATGGIDREDGHTLIPAVVQTLRTPTGGQHVEWDYVPVIADSLNARECKGPQPEASRGVVVATASTFAFESRYARNGRGAPSEVVPPLKAQSGESGKGDAAPLVYVPEIVPRAMSSKWAKGSSGPAGDEVAPPLSADADKGDQDPLVLASVAFTKQMGGNDGGVYQDGTTPTLTINRTPAAVLGFDTFNQAATGEVAHTLRVSTDNGLQSTPHVLAPAVLPFAAAAVRRLTPTECERLQGFPDGYTAITYRNKPACDGPRYKALGNSMAVPVMRWIGQRIKLVSALCALLLALPALAQYRPYPTPTRTPNATPTPWSVPTWTPTPVVPGPSPTPTFAPSYTATPSPTSVPTAVPTSAPSAAAYKILYKCNPPAPACQRESWQLELTVGSTATGVTVSVEAVK